MRESERERESEKEGDSEREGDRSGLKSVLRLNFIQQQDYPNKLKNELKNSLPTVI